LHTVSEFQNGDKGRIMKRVAAVFGSVAMSEVFSDAAPLRRMLDFEAAADLSKRWR
jgi:hypothetical protein